MENEQMYSALNHNTGESMSCPKLKVIFDVIRSERRYDAKNHNSPDRWTIHKGDIQSEEKIISESFYSFDGLTADNDSFYWAF